jgi:hypothetical protein
MNIETEMHIVGIVIGWILFAGYFWAVLNYFVKRVNRAFILGMPEDSPFRQRYAGFMRAVARSHVFVPLFLLTVLLLHLFIELIHVGFFVTGVVTLALMLAQISLGIYGVYIKARKKGPWLAAHRTGAALLSVSIAAHVTSVVILKP